MAEPQLLTSAKAYVNDNSAELLVGSAVVGLAGTAYLSARAGWRARGTLENEDPRLSFKEKTKRTWKHFVPPVITGAASIACMVGAAQIHNRRTAAAIAAYTLTDRAFTEYKAKATEVAGKAKEQKIRDAVVEDQVKKDPPPAGIFTLGKDEVLCCDLSTMRYFKSTMEILRKAENQINHQALSERWATLEDFYAMINVYPADNASRLGWDSDRLMELEFTAFLTPDGQPCMGFKFNYIKPL